MNKSVNESKAEQVFIVRAPHINGYGRLFGGQLMQWIDELAGIVCRRHSEMGVTTAAIDNLNFKDAAYQNDMIVLKGKLTYIGKTSMEVRVDTFIENSKGMRRCINPAYVVMVAIDHNGKPMEVPRLKLEAENERIEWNGGKKRYQLRKSRRKEGY